MTNVEKLNKLMKNHTISILEHERELERVCEEAYQAVLAERNKLEELEVDLYEDYDKKVDNIKEHIITKLDEYLESKGVETLKGRRAEDIFDEALEIENVPLKEQIKRLEAKNMRQSVDIAKLTEALRLTHEILTKMRGNNSLSGTRSSLYESRDDLGCTIPIVGKKQAVIPQEDVVWYIVSNSEPTWWFDETNNGWCSDRHEATPYAVESDARGKCNELNSEFVIGSHVVKIKV